MCLRWRGEFFPVTVITLVIRKESFKPYSFFTASDSDYIFDVSVVIYDLTIMVALNSEGKSETFFIHVHQLPRIVKRLLGNFGDLWIMLLHEVKEFVSTIAEENYDDEE